MFVYFIPKPVQNIITIKPPVVHSAKNDVTRVLPVGIIWQGEIIKFTKKFITYELSVFRAIYLFKPNCFNNCVSNTYYVNIYKLLTHWKSSELAFLYVWNKEGGYWQNSTCQSHWVFANFHSYNANAVNTKKHK